MAKVLKQIETPGVRGWLEGRTGRKADRTFRVRLLIQALFAVTCLVMGVQFASFYSAAQAGILPLPTRPPGVEAFLPISGLIGILDWVYQGTLNTIHPAATVLVAVALAMAVLLRKGFCSWVCPVGFISELLARFGRWSFGRNFRIWKWVDIPLRGLKYLIAFFFLWAIVTMGANGLQDFIQSPYNRVADLKMGLFFVDMSRRYDDELPLVLSAYNAGPTRATRWRRYPEASDPLRFTLAGFLLHFSTFLVRVLYLFNIEILPASPSGTKPTWLDAI